MNEREQIKGITRLLEETHGICGNFSGCTNRKCTQCYAEALYNAGYRKADEVRKETAKEILQTLYDKCFELDEEITVCKNCVDTADILQLAKCYGVEVEQ